MHGEDKFPTVMDNLSMLQFATETQDAVPPAHCTKLIQS